MLPTLTGPLAITARRVAILCAVGLVAVVGAIFAIRAYADVRLERARAQFEAEVGSLDPASYAPEAVENNSNIAFWIASGIEAADFEPGTTPEIVTRRSQSLGTPWTDDDIEAFAAVDADFEPARKLMDRAIGLERSNRDIDYASSQLDGNDPLLVLRAANLVTIQCDLALQRGDVDAAITDVILLERMAAGLRQEPMMLTILVGNAIEKMFHDRLGAVLGAVVKTSDLDRLEESLLHLERSSATVGRAVGHQGALFHGLYESALAGAGAGASQQELSSSRARRMLRLDWLVLANMLEVTAGIAALAQEPAATVDLQQWYYRSGRAAPWLPDPTTQVLMPNAIDAIKKEQVTLAARRLATTALELRRARLDTGAYPGALENPPVSDFTGEAASYRKLDDGGAEIAFPDSLRAWEALWTHGPPTGARSPDLVWRLPA